MWSFRRKKQVVNLKAADRIELSDGTTISLDEISVELIDLHRDLGSLNSGQNRLERKMNRWLDVLNIRERVPTNQAISSDGLPGNFIIPSNNPETAPVIAGEETEE